MNHNDDLDDRYPFMPVDCGRPIDAAMYIISAIGLIVGILVVFA